MLFWVIIKVGIKALWANKLRSFLAMLGIIIGVGAVISMLAIGAGAKKQILDRITAMGTNLLVVRPGQSGQHGVVSGTTQNLTVDDAQALLNKKEILGVRRLSPVVGGNPQVKHLGRNSRVSTQGVAATYLPIRDFEVERGRVFSELEVENRMRVAIIGPMTATNLFDEADPVNQTIKINSINFKVIGVLKSKGDQGWFNPDDQVLIPYTTAMHELFGVDYLREIDIQAEDGFDLYQLADDVTALLRKRHHLQAGAPDDFTIRNQADFINAFTSANKTFTVLLGCIASISLLVGGIGIMNIMLVTVTERTREIGVRKAIGAKESNILWQFLVESVIISGLGGLIGVGLGIGASVVIASVWKEFPTIVQVYSIALSLGFSGVVGIFFGLYPAWRAAKLDPIVALRYE